MSLRLNLFLITNSCSRLLRFKTKLVKGIINHLDLNGNLIIGHFLLLVDIILVMKNLFDVCVKLVNFM